MSDLCGCCTTGAPPVPARVENRPELSAIAYRVGTFAALRRAVLREIADTPALAGLRTRLSDDYSITLIELWAAVADILTFYQERVANEGFLRTARLRDSLLRMVRLLGYELRPGAAATTRLAFTLEPNTTLTIPAGLRVQSVPADGEKPQKFETLESLEATASLGRQPLLPPPTAYDALAATSVGGALTAEGTGVGPGQTLIMFGRRTSPVPTVVPLFNPEVGTTLGELVSALQADPSLHVTLEGHTHDSGNAAYDLALSQSRADALRAWLVSQGIAAERLTVVAYGSTRPVADNATPEGRAVNRRIEIVVDGMLAEVVPYDAETSASDTAALTTLAQLVSALQADPSLRLRLEGHTHDSGDAAYDLQLTRLRAQALRAWFVSQGTAAERLTVAAYGSARPVADNATSGGQAQNRRIEIVLVGPPQVEEKSVGTVIVRDDRTQVTWSPPIVIDRRHCRRTVRTLRLFGVNAPNSYLEPVFTNGAVSSWSRKSVGSTGYSMNISGEHLALDGLYEGLEVGTELVIHAPDLPEPHETTVAALTQIAAQLGPIAGTVTQVTLATPLPDVSDRREVVVYQLAGPPLTFWDRRYDDTITGSVVCIPLNRVRDVPVGRTVILDDEAAIPQTVQVTATASQDDLLHVTFTPALARALQRASAILFGNVAPASHGETVRNELVGDADAARPFLRFPLRRKPVTHVPAPVPGGVQSSLHLLVNGVEWREKPTLYGAAARDEIFVSRIADDGTLMVLFGDGEKGARPPTGRANIVATYRQGIGLAGRVRASSLTTLLDRPTGLKAATNPAAADGGADPETLAHAREAAPGTVRTFGRAVSLRDFEDVALASGEVAKAAATWVWAGETRAIHLTVAGQAGGTFTPDALQRIRATLDVERDANLPVLIDNYTRVPVVVVASLHVGGRYIAADVVAAARAALVARLSFDALRFGQPLHLSDIYHVLQQVPGVVAVDVDDLDFKSQDPAFRTAHGATAQRPQPSLRILPARPEAGAPVRVLPAELAWVEVPSQDVTLRASGGVTA